MTDVRWHEFPDAKRLVDAVAAEVRDHVIGAIRARGRALIALSGGTTPPPVFERLAPSIDDWSGVTILPTDDRLVDEQSPLSNAAMIRRYFEPLGATIVPLVSDTSDYRKTGEAAARRLADLDWPPDLIWLGMGADGHMGSIFPGPDTDAAIATSARALGVMPDPLPPEAPVARVTLSATAMRSTPALMLVITGNAKRAVLEQALAEGADSRYPVGRVLAGASGPVSVYWRE